MKKYLLIALLTAVLSPFSEAQTAPNDFEEELRLLELQEEKAEMLVEKIPSDQWLQDSVSTQKSAISKTTPLPEVAPISQESPTGKKKSRRIPSR